VLVESLRRKGAVGLVTVGKQLRTLDAHWLPSHSQALLSPITDPASQRDPPWAPFHCSALAL